jgi:hypothetical protein
VQVDLGLDRDAVSHRVSDSASLTIE